MKGRLPTRRVWYDVSLGPAVADPRPKPIKASATTIVDNNFDIRAIIVIYADADGGLLRGTTSSCTSTVRKLTPPQAPSRQSERAALSPASQARRSFTRPSLGRSAADYMRAPIALGEAPSGLDREDPPWLLMEIAPVVRATCACESLRLQGPTIDGASLVSRGSRARSKGIEARSYSRISASASSEPASAEGLVRDERGPCDGRRDAVETGAISRTARGAPLDESVDRSGGGRYVGRGESALDDVAGTDGMEGLLQRRMRWKDDGERDGEDI